MLKKNPKKMTRDEIAFDLKRLLEKDENILAAWEGGSAATGFQDEFSDLDLILISKDDAVEKSLSKIKNYLQKIGIRSQFRLPEPTWHGHSQAFFFLENSPKFYYIDLLIEKESAKNRLTEADRHGKAKIWFDKKNLIDLSPTSQKEIERKCQYQLKINKQIFPIYENDVLKYIKRKKFIDAMALYQGLIRRLISLLNIKYRPEKYDFGLRYLYFDFPQHEIDLIENLLQIENLEDLKKKCETSVKKFWELATELSN